MRTYLRWALALVLALCLICAEASGAGLLITPSRIAADAAAEAPVPEGLTQGQQAIYRQGYAAGYQAAMDQETTRLKDGRDYVLNINTDKFHLPDCDSVKQIREDNRREYFGSREELISLGFSPCKNCNP